MRTTGATATTSALLRGVGIVVLLVALLVCGAFAHAGHAAGHADHPPGHTHSTTAVPDGDTPHGHDATAGHHAGTVVGHWALATGPLTEAETCAGACGGELAVAALCFVALLGLAVLRMRSPAEQTWLPRVQPAAMPLTTHGRVPDGPCLHTLGVMRT